MEYVQKALELAEKFHVGQTYAGQSYVDGHLVPVSTTAKMIAEGLGFSDREVALVETVALLHDILEDTFCSMVEIRNILECPDEVADHVRTLTKDSCMSYANYLGFIVQGGIIPILIKLADSLCNYRQCLIDGDINRSLKYSKNINYLSLSLENEREKRDQT